MGQSPSVNLNVPKLSSRQALRNLVVEASFEPGSVMKPIVAAIALEQGVVSEGEILDCEHGRRRFGGYTIRDTHPLDLVTFREIVIKSSNIGMSKVAERLGKERLFAGLREFGFGSTARIGLPGETPGILRPVDSWAEIDLATHSYGQGVAVTPLQLVRAFTAVANGGNLVPLRLVNQVRVDQDEEVASARRIISEQTAARVRNLMQAVVEDPEGTGRAALLKDVIQEVDVGGKTGTAEKASETGRGYAKGKYVASFIGFVESYRVGLPYTLVLYVIADEPGGRSIYGGSVAAPVFKSIIQRSLAYLSRHFELSESRGATRQRGGGALAPAVDRSESREPAIILSGERVRSF